MFEKVSQIAEQMATKASRRQFLGRLGGAAMSVAAAAGGVLALAGAAKPGDRCSPTGSSFYCTNNVVGGPCGSGKCTVRKGTFNDCYCRDPGGGGRGGGGR